MRMEEDIAELRRQNEDVTGLMRQILRSLTIQGARPEGTLTQSFADNGMTAGQDPPLYRCEDHAVDSGPCLG